MTIKPLLDYVLCEKLSQESKTETGIYLPESVSKRYLMAKVISVGPGYQLDNGQRESIDIKPGQVVMFMSNAEHNKISVSETRFLIKEEFIVAITES